MSTRVPRPPKRRFASSSRPTPRPAIRAWAPYVLAVDDGRSDELLGHVGFSPLQGEVEVSFAIAESARKRGYAVEALLHGCGWIAGAFGLPSIVAVTAAGNAASRRTLERAGFAHERDEPMRFQGEEALVSRYRWRRDLAA